MSAREEGRLPTGVKVKPFVVGEQAKTCDCAEMRIEWQARDPRTGRLRWVVRYLPPNPRHDCEYVAARNALIPLAAAAARESGGTYSDEMDQLVAEHGLGVKF